MEDFGEGLATLVEHLVKKKGYTCTRWAEFRLPRISPKFTDRLAPMSVTVYSTYKLTHSDDGVIAE